MTTNTGGPAFPCHPGIENPIYDGMTLRDYFASKAMQALIDNDGLFSEIPIYAYALADAMLEARQA
jgi:hypothetical protein